MEVLKNKKTGANLNNSSVKNNEINKKQINKKAIPINEGKYTEKPTKKFKSTNRIVLTCF